MIGPFLTTAVAPAETAVRQQAGGRSASIVDPPS
jgi:hypothetical protein